MDKTILQNIFSRYIVNPDILETLSLKGYVVTVVTVDTKTREKYSNSTLDHDEKVGGCHHNQRNYRNYVTEEVVE